MTGNVNLIGLSGEYGGKTYPLLEGETLIGRGEECTLQIVDALISRTHAKLHSEDDDWILEDLGSTHGTFVKGIKIEKVVLQHGDTITIGATLLRFEYERSQDDVPTEMVSADVAASILDSPDAIPTEMVSDDDIATVLGVPDAIPTEMASPDDVPTEFVSPDDQATVMASEAEDIPSGGICAQCGNALTLDEKFCGECGAATTSEQKTELPIAPPTRMADAPPPAPLEVPPPPAVPPLVLAREKKPFPWKWVAIGGGALVIVLIVGVGLVLLGGLVGDGGASALVPPTSSDDELVLTLEALGEEETTPLIMPTLTPTPESEATVEVLLDTPEPTTETPEVPAVEPVIPSGDGFGGSVQLAFASNRTGRPQIYLIELETLEERQLTDVSGGACQPAWSSDGSRMLYTSPCNTNREEYNGASIYAMSVDPEGNPGEVTQLIVTIGGGDYDPAWSRDGSRIAFTSWRTGRPQIFTVNPDGTDPRNLNDDLAYNWAPSWSNDGSQLAFLTGRGGDEEIWTVPAGGGEERRFSRSDGKNVARPDWSPDGSTIVFEKVVGNIPRLIAAPVADGGVRELQVCKEGQLSLQPMGEPTWSPDGTWLAFETWPDGVNHEIAVMRASCTEYRQLTTDDGLDFDAAWRQMP
jgi:Tol biopolymer transport system component/pSer/pThr/pTyr-binding forkhead associated (FHA) protein